MGVNCLLPTRINLNLHKLHVYTCVRDEQLAEQTTGTMYKNIGNGMDVEGIRGISSDMLDRQECIGNSGKEQQQPQEH